MMNNQFEKITFQSLLQYKSIFELKQKLLFEILIAINLLYKPILYFLCNAYQKKKITSIICSTESGLCHSI